MKLRAVVAILLSLPAETLMAAPADIASTHVLASSRTFQIDSTECRNGAAARTLTGFLLRDVGIVTAAHGIVGCTVNASPARAPFPARSAAKKTKIFFERDLAILEPPAGVVPLSTGLGIFDSKNPKNANRFMVCGFPTAYAAYVCFPVEILPDSPAKLIITLDAAADPNLKPRFVDRRSPDPAIGIYPIGPWDFLQPGLSGAPVMDWFTGDVIAVVDGGLTLKDGRHAAWAIPIEPAVMADHAWVKYDNLPRDTRLTKLTYDSLPAELMSSDRSVPPGVRPMKLAERASFREIAALFAQGLLETYSCQWMRVGVHLMNTLCGAAPCSDFEILQLYAQKIVDLKPQIPKVCDAIRTEVRGLSMVSTAPAVGAVMPGGGVPPPAPGDPVLCDQSKAEYWFADYGNVPFGRILLPRGGGVAAQTSLIFNILWVQVPEPKRNEVLGQTINEWETGNYTPNKQYFASAAEKFEALRQACAPGGCDLGIAGRTTNDGWPLTSRVLFEQWFNIFTQLQYGFVVGCADARIAKGADGRWEYKTGRNCNSHEASCYDFGKPAGTAKAGQRFADAIRIDQAGLELTVSADADDAHVGQQLVVTTLIKNLGPGDSGPFQVVTPLPTCAEHVSSEPAAEIDPVTRTATWTRDSLPAGGLDAVKLTLKAIACSDPHNRLDLVATARTERDKRGASNRLSLPIKAPPP